MQARVILGTVSDFGYGSGYGYGYGSGSGYGDGYGDGYGYGYGSGDFWVAAIDSYAALWSTQQQTRLSELRELGATIAYWRSDEKGRACNGGSSQPVAVGTVEESSGPLRLCEKGTLHATHQPHKFQGQRLWIVALLGEVVGDEHKLGALKREIIGEAKAIQ